MGKSWKSLFGLNNRKNTLKYWMRTDTRTPSLKSLTGLKAPKARTPPGTYVPEEMRTEQEYRTAWKPKRRRRRSRYKKLFK